MEIDETDKKLLKSLTMDARQSGRQLSLRLGMSTVTILNRIKKLEKSKVIKGYTAVVDCEKVGYTLTAIIEITAKKGKIIEMENHLSKFENVCGVYDVTGSTDTIIITKFRDRAELSEFVKSLASIPDVENTITHLVLNTVKEDFRLV